MNKKIRFFYPWATLGGVERVLINRARVLLSKSNEYKICFHFLHDSGGLKAFSNTLARYGLDVQVDFGFGIVNDYDVNFIIDCPDVLDLFESKGWPYFIECHTAYLENQSYLSKRRSSCMGVVVPGRDFGEQIRVRYQIPEEHIHIFENFVPWDLEEDHSSWQCLPRWSRTPLCFLGRMDKLKNPGFYLDLLTDLEARYPERFMGVMCGPRSPEVDIRKEIVQRKMLGRVLVLPSIPFYSVSPFFHALKSTSGIFVSPSQGESFGLSAAEAICAGLPVLLSKIDAHEKLVMEFGRDFIYENQEDALVKIGKITEDYEGFSSKSLILRDNFQSSLFVSNFTKLLGKQ